MSRRLMARTHTVLQIEPMAAWLGHPTRDSMKTGGTSATAAARRCTELSLRVGGGNKGSSLTGACTINRTLITMHD